MRSIELGMRAVVMTKMGGTPTEEQVARYNAVVRPPVQATASDFLVRGFYLMNDLPMRETSGFYRSFDAEAIKQAQPLVIGKPVLANHTMQIGGGLEGLPQARYFDAFVDSGPEGAPAGSSWLGVLAAFPADDLGKMLVRRIDLGTIGESSPTVDYDTIYCSICGALELRCDHVPGELYEGLKCRVVMSDIADIHEGSMVWAGQQTNTRYFIAAGRVNTDQPMDSDQRITAALAKHRGGPASSGESATVAETAPSSWWNWNRSDVAGGSPGTSDGQGG